MLKPWGHPLGEMKPIPGHAVNFRRAGALPLSKATFYDIPNCDSVLVLVSSITTHALGSSHTPGGGSEFELE